MPTPRLVYLPLPSNNVSEERISADRDRSTECFPEVQVCKSKVKPFPTWSTDAPEQLKLEKEPKNASQSSEGPGPFHVQTPNFTASNYQNPSISLLPRQRQQQQQDHQGIFHFSTRRTYRHGKNSVGPFTVTKNINTGTGRAFTEVEKVPQHQIIMNAEERERDCNSTDESLPQPKAMRPIADEIKTDSLSSSIPPDTVGSSPSPSSSIKPIHSQSESSRPPTSQCSQIMSISLRNGTNDDGRADDAIGCSAISTTTDSSMDETNQGNGKKNNMPGSTAQTGTAQVPPRSSNQRVQVGHGFSIHSSPRREQQSSPCNAPSPKNRQNGNTQKLFANQKGISEALEKDISTCPDIDPDSAAKSKRSTGYKKKHVGYDKISFENYNTDHGEKIKGKLLKTVIDEDKNMKKLVTGFTYAVVCELMFITFEKRDRRGKRINFPAGFPGMACRHCQGIKGRTGRYFPSSVKTISDSKKSLYAMYGHLAKCESCPDEVRKNLISLFTTHTHERKNRCSHGSQREFFKKIWKTLHPRSDDMQSSKRPRTETPCKQGHTGQPSKRAHKEQPSKQSCTEQSSKQTLMEEHSPCDEAAEAALLLSRKMALVAPSRTSPVAPEMPIRPNPQPQRMQPQPQRTPTRPPSMQSQPQLLQPESHAAQPQLQLMQPQPKPQPQSQSMQPESQITLHELQLMQSQAQMTQKRLYFPKCATYFASLRNTPQPIDDQSMKSKTMDFHQEGDVSKVIESDCRVLSGSTGNASDVKEGAVTPLQLLMNMSTNLNSLPTRQNTATLENMLQPVGNRPNHSESMAIIQQGEVSKVMESNNMVLSGNTSHVTDGTATALQLLMNMSTNLKSLPIRQNAAVLENKLQLRGNQQNNSETMPINHQREVSRTRESNNRILNGKTGHVTEETATPLQLLFNLSKHMKNSTPVYGNTSTLQNKLQPVLEAQQNNSEVMPLKHRGKVSRVIESNRRILSGKTDHVTEETATPLQLLFSQNEHVNSMPLPRQQNDTMSTNSTSEGMQLKTQINTDEHIFVAPDNQKGSAMPRQQQHVQPQRKTPELIGNQRKPQEAIANGHSKESNYQDSSVKDNHSAMNLGQKHPLNPPVDPKASKSLHRKERLLDYKNSFENCAIEHGEKMKGCLLKTILEEDQCTKTMVSKFTYAVVSELVVITFEQRDRRGKRINFPVGFPGMACRYCQGRQGRTGRYFPSSIKTISDSKKSLYAMYSHLANCEACPIEVRKNLRKLHETHTDERKNFCSHGSQREFFKRIWRTLHPDRESS